MMFRIQGRIRPKGEAVAPVSPKPITSKLSTEETCRACEWFNSRQLKCAHPNVKYWAVCYRSSLRVSPWKAMPCPLRLK